MTNTKPQWTENFAAPWIADTQEKAEAVNALGLAAPIRLGDHTPYWPIDKGYAKHA